ncbi:hypothetical protein [Williamwhitmania taraxaci]|uniref:Uncharacterized protein n=1 Tax=Williamwhitmania taraxaci TaxID=1640674 RepID=A0A1G6LHA1_9BACT|nr:hypothetical protein [Williamwhitmania taraxaci]SDC42584.1 hypothetical protein SAMN05216323_10315 [Williamwhitmania taraxaci]
MSLKEKYQALTPTEKSFIWIIVVLAILVALRWEYISERVIAGFNFFFNRK